jgi:hypothetical protein
MHEQEQDSRLHALMTSAIFDTLMVRPARVDQARGEAGASHTAGSAKPRHGVARNNKQGGRGSC